MNTRELAAKLLSRWHRSTQFADELLQEALRTEPLSEDDSALVSELFYGCIRQKLVLEAVLGQLATKAPKDDVATLLHIGIYQILFLTKIPGYAAVNDTVAAAKRIASSEEAKFVNAILRRVAREEDKLRQYILELKDSKPWIAESHPQWLFEKWRSHWGLKKTIALCEWNNQPPPIYLRLNTLKASTISSKMKAQQSSLHPLCWKASHTRDLFTSINWENGEFYIQDPSTLMAVDLLDPQPGESILDMCAAPGGKTTYIAQKMENRGQIIAADSSSARLGLVGENCRRLGVTIVATLACNGTHLDRCLRGEMYDRVLVDAPCSNTGVMRRRADLRWRLTEQEIGRLAKLQMQLIRAAKSFTKSGGILVYSTCSLESEENQQVIETISDSEQDLMLEESRIITPLKDKMDGAYVARFRKG